jgi:hypothetical protein
VVVPGELFVEGVEGGEEGVVVDDGDPAGYAGFGGG